MCKNNPTSRLLLTLFLILFIISICFTGYAGNLVKNYHFNSPQIISSGNYTEIIFNGAVNYGIPGKPILPVFPVMLLLPPEETAIDISIEYLDPVTLQGTFVLKPGQECRPLSYAGDDTFLMDKETYQSDMPYPGRLHYTVRTDFMNGYGFALSDFTPVSYIPSRGEITYYQNVRVHVETVENQRAAKAYQRVTQA